MIAAFRAGFVHKLVGLTPFTPTRCISECTYAEYRRGYAFAEELFPEAA